MIVHPKMLKQGVLSSRISGHKTNLVLSIVERMVDQESDKIVLRRIDCSPHLSTSFMSTTNSIRCGVNGKKFRPRRFLDMTFSGVFSNRMTTSFFSDHFFDGVFPDSLDDWYSEKTKSAPKGNVSNDYMNSEYSVLCHDVKRTIFSEMSGKVLETVTKFEIHFREDEVLKYLHNTGTLP